MMPAAAEETNTELLVKNLQRADNERLRQFLCRLLDNDSTFEPSVQEATRRALTQAAQSNNSLINDEGNAGEGNAGSLRVDAFAVDPNDIIEVSAQPLEFSVFGKTLKRKHFFIACAVFFSIVAIVVSLLIYYSVRDRKELRTTPAPTPVFRNVTELIQKLQTEFYGSDLRNPQSSQSKAMDWIVNETDVLPSFTGLLDMAHLVSFYFSTGGDWWSVCSRFDANCTGSFKSWLRDTDFCNWYGVYGCDNFDRVTGLNFDTDQMQLNGTLPVDIGFLQKITLIEFPDAPHLHGTIPSEIGMLKDLFYFDIKKSKVTGPIPSTMFTAEHRMTFLILPENDLTGTISTHMGQLSLLATVSLFNNRINGSIPIELAALDSLGSLYLQHNSMTGTVPEEICKFTPDEFTVVIDYTVDCPVNCSCLAPQNQQK